MTADDAVDRMTPLAHRLVDAVRAGDRRRVARVLADADNVACAAGQQPGHVLVVVLASLVPDPQERAAITVLRHSTGPEDADELLAMLGLAGHREAA